MSGFHEVRDPGPEREGSGENRRRAGLRAPGSRAQPVGETGSGDAPGWGWTLGFWERAGRPVARVQKVPGGGYFPWPALGRRCGGAGRRSPSTAGRGARISGARAKARETAATELSFPSDPRFPCSPRPLHSPSLLTSPTPTVVTLPPLRLATLTSLPTFTAPGGAVSLEPAPPHPLTRSLSFLSSPSHQLLVPPFSLLTSLGLSLTPINPVLPNLTPASLPQSPLFLCFTPSPNHLGP